jgi:hypothetical protein
MDSFSHFEYRSCYIAMHQIRCLHCKLSSCTRNSYMLYNRLFAEVKEFDLSFLLLVYKIRSQQLSRKHSRMNNIPDLLLVSLFLTISNQVSKVVLEIHQSSLCQDLLKSINQRQFISTLLLSSRRTY